MRAYCDGCGRMRKITMILNPRGSFFKISENGDMTAPEQKRFCEECAEIRMKRLMGCG